MASISPQNLDVDPASKMAHRPLGDRGTIALYCTARRLPPAFLTFSHANRRLLSYSPSIDQLSFRGDRRGIRILRPSPFLGGSPVRQKFGGRGGALQRSENPPFAVMHYSAGSPKQLPLIPAPSTPVLTAGPPSKLAYTYYLR